MCPPGYHIYIYLYATTTTCKYDHMQVWPHASMTTCKYDITLVQLYVNHAISIEREELMEAEYC